MCVYNNNNKIFFLHNTAVFFLLRLNVPDYGQSIIDARKLRSEKTALRNLLIYVLKDVEGWVMGICISVCPQKIRWKRVCWNSSLKWRFSCRWLERYLPWNLNLKVISRFQNKWSVWCTCAPIFFANTHALTPTHTTHTLNTHTLSTHTHSQHTHTLNTHTLTTVSYTHLTLPTIYSV